MFNKLRQLWKEESANFKEDKIILDISKDIYNYWRVNNNFLITHIRYLQDLDYRFHLNLGEENITKITSTLSTSLLAMGLTQTNTMWIFSQFVFYHIFGGHKPNQVRHSDEYIFRQLEILERLLVSDIPSYHKSKYKFVLSNKLFEPI